MINLLTLASLVPLVAAHGFIFSPAPRRPGETYKATCGDAAYTQQMQTLDIYGPVQGLLNVAGTPGTDFDAEKCGFWLCKGFFLDDNTENVHSFALGETIEFAVNITATHTGWANVSVVKTSSNSVIGQPLIEFQNYASDNGVDANNTAFSVTLPNDLNGECATAGECVIQWFWDTPIAQTFESCLDFIVSGDGSGSDNSMSASTPVATTIAIPTSAASTVLAEQATTGSIQTTTASDAAPTTSVTPSRPCSGRRRKHRN
ncbi:hypothetical protein G7Z17_g747 [Cylindrodendrum hubeiense]|uniref:Chitin-binding type-4 domain-containing protein n=1 Tax=Cylindrodendrum hubeiense TaxID=595255 RepID=A0A9P5HPF1_9HYPO|nr:hypothetical protein G7Z17_g747 [Cylindrodendrum hubeiense]